jgi:bacteriophage CI repressor helix-turn-helix domain
MSTAKSFEAKFARCLEATHSTKHIELAKVLEINPSSVTAAKRRRQIPTGWIETIAEKFNVNANWLFFGSGPMYISSSAPLASNTPPAREPDVPDIIMIPMVEAVLSAGGGSLETNSTSERSYAFRRDFIQRKGSPEHMVLMRVSGDSMEPEIMDGDVVLLDQSKTRIVPGKMFAVGFEEAIYLKKIDMLPGKIVLKSANLAYPPVELDVRGQCEDFFRVIGRVLWSGREYK